MFPPLCNNLLFICYHLHPSTFLDLTLFYSYSIIYSTTVHTIYQFLSIYIYICVYLCVCVCVCVCVRVCVCVHTSCSCRSKVTAAAVECGSEHVWVSDPREPQTAVMMKIHNESVTLHTNQHIIINTKCLMLPWRVTNEPMQRFYYETP